MLCNVESKVTPTFCKKAKCSQPKVELIMTTDYGGAPGGGGRSKQSAPVV